VNKVVFVPGNSASQLKAAIAQGPTAVSLNAADYGFLHYFGGIISDPETCGTAVTHEAAAVGYGSEDGVEYYLIKNSWGADWGENGYVRIKVGGEDDPGICGVQEIGRYPEIK
jgi:KDEL-tailed cysteine endopeptidase